MCSDKAELQTETADSMQSLTQTDVKEPTTANETAKSSSMNIVYFSMMVSTTAYSLAITSTWPYLQKIDQSVSPKFYGWTLFAFCLSSIVADLIYGKWMNLRPSREPLLCSMLAMMLSGLIYAMAQGIGGSNGLWTVLISRIFLGFVRGNMTITRTVTSESTTLETRTNALTNLGILQTIGFALGPAIQALVSFIGEKGLYISVFKMSLNLYTVPALAIILFAIVNGALIIKYFREVKVKQSEASDSRKDSEPIAKKLLPAICVIGMWAIVSFSISAMDTTMVPFIQHQFAFTRANATKYAGFVFAGQGLIGLFHQLLLKQLLKRFTDRVLVLFGFTILFMSFVFFIPFGNKKVKIAENIFFNGTLKTAKHGEVVGCPVKYDWCKTTPQIWLPSFIFAVFCLAVGFATSFTILISLYTKLLPNQKQGTAVSILSAVGNTGRLVAPIAGSASYVDIGPRYTYTCICALVLTGLLFYLSLYKRMVPPVVGVETETADELILKERTEGDSQCGQVLYASSV